MPERETEIAAAPETHARLQIRDGGDDSLT
jgi:hypothetical protein